LPLALGALAVLDLAASRLAVPALAVEAPAEAFVGEDVALGLLAAPCPAGLVVRGDWPEGLAGPAEVGFAAGRAKATLAARRRGRWPLGRLRLAWPSRLGLFEILPRVALDHAVTVVPDVRPALTGRIETEVRSALFGAKATRTRGEGSEFHQLREFVPGVDPRAIDWKASARHRALLAREWQAERNHRVILAIDAGHLMRETIDALPRLDHAINAALALGWAGAVGGDRVGLYAYDERPRLWLPPAPGRAAFARLRAATASIDYAGVETNHALGLVTLANRLARRSLVVVFAEFADTTSAELLVEHAGLLARRHVVVFVCLRDPTLARLATAPPHDLDAVAGAVVAGAMTQERRLVMERLSRAGLVVLDVEARRLTPRLVSTYLDLRAREAV
ncbi:MAG: DUF58 domain-containing protein, partial [Paracoccaceae bacterium]